MTKPFPHLPHPSDLQWRVGAVAKSADKCQALAYTDSRAVYALLDDLGAEWSTNVLGILPVGKEYAVTVALTINGMTRTDVGQDDDTMSAQARGLKRAAMQFGIFAGLWSLPTVWVAYDSAKQCITEGALAKLNQAYARRYERMVADNAQPQIADANAEPWRNWSTPHDAYAWAVSSGVANVEIHAKNALRKLVEAQFAGKMTTTTWPTIAEAYYHERLQRQAEKASA